MANRDIVEKGCMNINIDQKRHYWHRAHRGRAAVEQPPNDSLLEKGATVDG